jgi:hypothetical protein
VRAGGEGQARGGPAEQQQPGHVQGHEGEKLQRPAGQADQVEAQGVAPQRVAGPPPIAEGPQVVDGEIREDGDLDGHRGGQVGVHAERAQQGQRPQVDHHAAGPHRRELHEAGRKKGGEQTPVQAGRGERGQGRAG